MSTPHWLSDSGRPTAPRLPTVVPYITPWEREQTLYPARTRRWGPEGAFLGYVDETPHDRDQTRGVLWTRQGLARGRGKPQLEAVHALRQRRAMNDLLCQVCGKHTLPEYEDRHLFLFRDVGRPVTEWETTTSPPVCVPCARISVRECPRLRKGHIAVQVRDVIPWGVAGLLYDPGTLRAATDDLVELAYADPRIRWAIARRSVVALHGCTPVDLSGFAV